MSGKPVFNRVALIGMGLIGSSIARAARAQGRYIGLGLANAVKGTGRGPFESGVVRIAPSGRVLDGAGAVRHRVDTPPHPQPSTFRDRQS